MAEQVANVASAQSNIRNVHDLVAPLSTVDHEPPISAAPSAYLAFTARRAPTSTGTGFDITVLPEAILTPLEFYVSDDPQYLIPVFQAIFVQLEDATGHNQICSNFLALLNLIMPGLRPSIEEFFKNRGFKLVEIKLPSQAEEYGIEVPELAMSYPELLTVLGQYILCVYKNFTQANFTTYMTTRIRAMMAKVGILPTSNRIDIAPSKEKAEVIRGMAGSDALIRRSILEYILQLRTRAGPVGGLFAYLAVLLEWAEMNNYILMNEVLLTTKSPVLTDHRVLAEVKNLAEATRAVATFTQPQYWRIMADPIQYHLLDRAKFPTLVDVCLDVKKDTHPSLANFAQPARGLRQTTISDLVRIHRSSAGQATSREYYGHLSYLLDE